MKKTINKVIMLVFTMIIVMVSNVAFAQDTQAPTIKASIENNSTVKAGTKVTFTIEDNDNLKSIFVETENGGRRDLLAGKENVFYQEYYLQINESCFAKIEAVDVSGNTSGVKKFNYIVEKTDNTAPEIKINIADGSTLDKDTKLIITVKDSESKITFLQYRWGNKKEVDVIAAEKDYANEATVTVDGIDFDEGEYELTVTAENECEKCVTKTYTYHIEKEKETDAPTISVSKPNGAEVNPGDRVTVEIKDESGLRNITYSWNDKDEVRPLSGDSKTYHEYKIEMGQFPKVNDTYTLKISAEDIHGNSTGVKEYKYKVIYKDSTAPEISMSKPSGSVLEPGTRLTLTVEDMESKVTSLKYNWVGSAEKQLIPNEKEPANTCTIYIPKIGSAIGTYKFTVTAINSAGGKTSKEFIYYIKGKDEEKPTVTANPKSGTVIKKQETIELIAKDNEELKSLTYSWNNGEKIPKTISGKSDSVELTAPNKVGTHKLTVTVVDAANNIAEEEFTYTIKEEEIKDNEKPTVTATPKSGTVIKKQATIELTAKDNEELKSLTYSWNNGEKIPKTISGKSDSVKSTAPNKVGTHKLTVTVVDAANNIAEEEFTYTIKEEEIKDEEKPTVSVDPNGGDINANDPVDIIGKDNEALEEITYNWDDEEPITKYVGGTSATIETEVPEEEGEHTLYVTVKDEAGNIVEDEFEFNVGDDEKPTISMNPKGGSTVVGGKVVKATLKDNVALKKVTYNWEDDDEETKTLSGTSKTISLPALPKKEGTYKVTIVVEDNNKNVTKGTYTYYVKNEDEGEEPTVDADPDGGTLEYGDKITVSADDDGEIEYVEYYWDDDDDDTTKKYDDKFTVKVPSKEGKHYLYVRAMDDDDNLCDYERFTYTIEENNYPGNSDITGQINTNVRILRVEIRNADDKIRFEPEEEILYYVDYYNGTSSKVSNVKIEVELPTYLEADEASDKGNITTKKVTWNIGTLASKASGRVSFIAHYTTDKYNERIITVPAKIYSGSSLKDTSTVRNMIFCEGASGTGNHQAYCVGYPDGTFLPEGKITRAELASMIANIEGLTSTTYRGQFTDVNNHWAAKYIQAVVDKGYMKPSGYSTFGAQSYATRADLAYAIAAILEVEDLEPIFIYSTDVKYSDARCAIEQLLRLGIMDGYSDGTSKPNNNITRAEAVTIINNYLFRGELHTKGYNYSYNYDVNYNHGGSNYILKFKDLSSNHWAYGHIMEATNNHRYQRIMDGNEEML